MVIIFTHAMLASAVLAMERWLAVCLSHVGIVTIVSKRLNLS